MHRERQLSIANESQEKSNSKTTVRHNLQNSKLSHQETKIKTGKGIYSIPSIVNGKSSWEDESKFVKSGTASQKREKLYTWKETVTRRQRSNKIVIIGDSHVRGLADKVSCNLGEAFNVIGISKPNADIEGITSSLNTSIKNLTKKDVIIFYGGTKDISKNESRKGLHSLKTFIQKTINTNVILLRAPFRYDLSSISCVNKEVNLFNKRLQSFMLNFNHVRFLNLCTERAHHTNHGLHLNTKGKDWVTHNLVKDIRNLYLTDSTSSPIALPWKDVKENTSQITQWNEDGLNEIKTIVDGQINIINNDVLDKMKPKLEPSRKSNRIKKAIATNQNDFLWAV
jgi:hypothetical protein